MQFSHFEPVVRHAILAIGSLYECNSRGHHIIVRNSFAINHYNAALKQMSLADNEQLMLLLCVMFICIEYLRGDIDTAVKHIHYGIIMLNESRCSTWVEQHLVPIFRRLSLVPMFGEAKSRCLPKLIGFNAPISIPFNGVSEAQSSIDDLAAQVLEVKLSGCNFDRCKLASTLDMWDHQIGSLEDTVPMSPIYGYAICSMRIKHEIAKIHLDTPLEHTEVWFDQYLDAFKRVIALARKASQIRASLGSQLTLRPCFSFEACFLPHLFFVVSKCRSLRTRLQGLAWMAQFGPSKEGLFDAGTLYQVSRRIIELEHEISLDDDRYNHTYNLETPSWTVMLPAEEKRVFAVSMSRELSVASEGQHDGTCYERRVCFLMRKSEGQVYTLKEHIYSTI
jgi:hypothetical protein